MLACAQLGITVASISLGVVAEPAIAHALEPIMVNIGLPESAAHGIALIIALTIIVSLHVIIGEMVPKNAAVSNPDRAALLLGPPLVVVARVLRPIIAALNWAANCIVRLLGVEPRDEVRVRSRRTRSSRSLSDRAPKGHSTTPRACSLAPSSFPNMPRRMSWCRWAPW